MTMEKLFKVYALQNEIICSQVKMAKYMVSIKWENQDGLFILRIELAWDSDVTTLAVFQQLGLFASNMGLVSEVKISSHSAVIQMAVAVAGEKECPQTIDRLGESIAFIRGVLKRCLTPECSIPTQSDGLDNPESEKSKVLRRVDEIEDFYAKLK